MVTHRCNPYIDTPHTISKVVLMVISTIVFIGGVIYGAIRGTLWCWLGKKRERRLDDFHTIMHKIFKLDLRLHPWLSCDIQNPYGENFEQGAIAICNHQSLIDTLCLLILSPKILIVTGKRVWNNPIIKPVLHFAEFTCINRTMDEMLEYCRYHIARGYTIVIFPEGERSLRGDILRFHSGAFYIAKELKADILPLYIHGTGHVLPLHKAFQNKAKLYVEIGQRVSFDTTASMDVRKQANIFRHHYRQHYEDLCRKLENTDYFTYLVVNLFKREGIRKYASELLKRYHNFSEWIDRPFEEGLHVAIEDHTDGVFTLMFALVHPYLNISVIGAGSLRKLYKKCGNLPANISFAEAGISTGIGTYKPLFTIGNTVKVSTNK